MEVRRKRVTEEGVEVVLKNALGEKR